MNSVGGNNPYFIPDICQVYPTTPANGSWQGNSPYAATTGRTVRNLTLNTGIRNLILIIAGQSNRESEAPTAYTLVNTTAVDNFNVYDGAVYAWAEPALGCSYNGTGPGHIGGRIADKFITGGQFDRVIVVPIAVGGTDVSIWATGSLKNLIPMTLKRLADRGFTAQTNVTVAIEWGQGEAEVTLGTTQAAYTTALNTVIANAQAAGFSGRFFVAKQTWSNGVNSAIQAAQAAVVNNTTVFASGNIDTLDNTNRVDLTHLNDTGIASAATLIYNAMHASGAPF